MSVTVEATCREMSHDCGDWRCPFDRIRCGNPLPCRQHPERCDECRRAIAPDGTCSMFCSAPQARQQTANAE